MVLSRGVGHTGNADWSTAPSCGHAVMQSCSQVASLRLEVFWPGSLESNGPHDRTLRTVGPKSRERSDSGTA